MKQKLMTHYCFNKDCDYLEQSHKIRDGWNCPKCKGPIKSEDAPRGRKSAVSPRCRLSNIVTQTRCHKKMWENGGNPDIIKD
ncbi:hypothetical protein PMJ1TS6_03120 [Paenibacillus melissococcoides]